MTPFQIRRQRKALGLTADKYAERLGLRGKHRGLLVYGWESGRKKPGAQTIFLMKQLRDQSFPPHRAQRSTSSAPKKA